MQPSAIQAHGQRQVVWYEGGGLGRPTIEVEGAPDTHVGCVRRVALGVRERIAVTSNALVEYNVVSGFPVHAHRGRVTFAHAATDGVVTVTWTCDFSPFLGLGCILAVVIRSTFTYFLRTLRHRAAAKVE